MCEIFHVRFIKSTFPTSPQMNGSACLAAARRMGWCVCYTTLPTKSPCNALITLALKNTSFDVISCTEQIKLSQRARARYLRGKLASQAGGPGGIETQACSIVSRHTGIFPTLHHLAHFNDVFHEAPPFRTATTGTD